MISEKSFKSPFYNQYFLIKYRKQILELIVNYSVKWLPEDMNYVEVGKLGTVFGLSSNHFHRSKNAT